MKDAWYKRNPRDYYEATRELSLEERGAYGDIIDLLYMHGGAIPDDAKWISHALHVSTRKWAAIRDALLNAQKIRIEDGKIGNERVSRELDSRAVQARTNSETALNRERTKRENRQKTNENNETEAQKQHHLRKKKEEEEKKQQPLEQEAPRASAVVGEIDFAALNAKLARAGGVAMRSTAISIHDPSPIVGCLQAGADLDLDVIPTIERIAGAKPAGSISGWNYFAGAIAKAAAARKSGSDGVAKRSRKISFAEESRQAEEFWAAHRQEGAETNKNVLLHGETPWKDVAHAH